MKIQTGQWPPPFCKNHQMGYGFTFPKFNLGSSGDAKTNGSAGKIQLPNPIRWGVSGVSLKWGYIPSSNQRRQWKPHHLWMIFLFKPPFLDDVPLPGLISRGYPKVMAFNSEMVSSLGWFSSLIVTILIPLRYLRSECAHPSKSWIIITNQRPVRCPFMSEFPEIARGFSIARHAGLRHGRPKPFVVYAY